MDIQPKRNSEPKCERPKILIILHQELSSPGRVGHVLLESGFDLDVRRPPLGDELPATLDHHAGAVVFGGPMSANDEDEFVRRETDWLKVPLAENRPVSRHLPRRADAGQPSRRQGREPS